MKKSIETKLALYPTPVTIVGAMNGDKPTWTLVAHIGIIGHDRILVSLAEPHFINHVIKDNGSLTADTLLGKGNEINESEGLLCRQRIQT